MNKSFGQWKQDESFAKCQYLQALKHEEIKEEVEISSWKHEDKSNKIDQIKLSNLNHRKTQWISGKNPFINIENNSGSK